MKNGASGSLLIATITFDELTPAKCWIAPEIPIAIYKFGLIVIPVCPTCSLCGLQCISLTGFEQAVAAPNALAKSSTKCQFSGPFKPRPPLITNSASVNAILPLALDTSIDLVLKSFAST